jgi:L-ascorbate metabolism protein UlaG (beta-lactamase superfamily)
MRTHLSRLGLLACLFLCLQTAHAISAAAGDVEPTRGGPLTIRPLTHGSLLFQWRGRAIYVDPAGNYDWAALPKADLVLITHEHPDHCSPETVAKIRKSDTRIVANGVCAKQFPGAIVMKNGDQRRLLDVKILAVPAYNMVRKAPNGQFFHPKGRDNGYLLTIANKRIYVAGDTEAIPEMAKLGRVDIAFLPINLPYTMPPKEAAKAARMIRPHVLYPYHQGQSNPAELKRLLAGMKGTEVRVRALP